MKTKTVAYLGIATALYVALSMALKIPLIGHIQTDLGYIAFGFALYCFGVPALVVGVIGCMIESMIFSGWIPIGWMAGQALIGIICGLAYKKTDNKVIHIFVTVAAMLLGIVCVKSIIECSLYGIPYAVKIPKNLIACVADLIPMIVGLLLGYRLKGKVKV